MEWININSSYYNPCQCVDRKGNIHHLMLSPISIPEEVIDGEIINMKCLFERTTHIPTIQSVRQLLNKLIIEYDKSYFVNSFKYKDYIFWFHKDERLSLKNKFTILLEQGIQTNTIWFDSVKYDVYCDRFLNFLNQLEIYASDCNDITRTHLHNIENISILENLLSYNITNNYPEVITIDDDVFVNNQNINNN